MDRNDAARIAVKEYFSKLNITVPASEAMRLFDAFNAGFDAGFKTAAVWPLPKNLPPRRQKRT